jgi:poly(A) polymerase
MISSGTLKTLYTLKDAGYEAYMVGGGVRDLLAGIEPKDFDVATNAHPEQVKPLFRSCRLVGRRFVICHVRFGDEIVETTTFRGAITDMHKRDDTGRILSDNVYGSLEEDAIRRDFTVNALYYDIRDYSIVDFTTGIEDMKSGVIRLIGDPELRYREDPVRMLRAIRIANKLHFRIDEATAAPIARLAPLLREIPAARLFDEVLKLLLSKEAEDNLYGMRVYGLFRQLFPVLDPHLAKPDNLKFVNAALRSTAQRMQSGLPVSPAFLYASLLWPAVEARAAQLRAEQGYEPFPAIQQAGEEVIAKTIACVAIPKRFSLPMRDIWDLQPRFEQTASTRARRLMTHPKFRAAYDFLLVRGESSGNPALAELAAWWTEAQKGGDLPQPPDLSSEDLLVEGTASETAPPRKRRRRRGGRNRRGPNAAGDTEAVDADDSEADSPETSADPS